MLRMLQSVWRLPGTILVAGITLYQQTLSPDHGPLRTMWPYGFCPKEPTCSEYGKRVILERGALLGSLLLLRRLLSCHPWRKPSEEKMRRLVQERM